MQSEEHHPLIEVKDISYEYNGNVVLDRVSFVIQKGDYMGIIGPNGGGKTTLLKILVGLLKPSSGSVHINSKPIEKLTERANIAYVSQRIAQENITFPATVYEIVQSGRLSSAHAFCWKKDHDLDAIEHALATAQITPLKDRLLSQLSGGQRQRVYVARALASEAKILILDEPFVGIDIVAQKEFYEFLRTLNQEQGITIIFVSHDIDIITQEATSLLCLNRGVLFCGSVKEINESTAIEHLYGKRITHIHHA